MRRLHLENLGQHCAWIDIDDVGRILDAGPGDNSNILDGHVDLSTVYVGAYVCYTTAGGRWMTCHHILVSIQEGGSNGVLGAEHT